MIKLSIITINKNNYRGLQRTLHSISIQTNLNIEYIIVDGNSQDDSQNLIQQYADQLGDNFKWISEKDTGIFQAMNKGIAMASGQYVQFLNSGDCLYDANVVQLMLSALEEYNDPDILYGNMVKEFTNGTLYVDKGFEGRIVTFFDMFSGTLNHSSALIRKKLFEQYGCYDENLKIVADWKWYFQIIMQQGIQPVYVDKNVTLFDMTGISNTNKLLEAEERKQFLLEILPTYVYDDYISRCYNIKQLNRIKHSTIGWKLFNYLDTLLVKTNK